MYYTNTTDRPLNLWIAETSFLVDPKGAVNIPDDHHWIVVLRNYPLCPSTPDDEGTDWVAIAYALNTTVEAVKAETEARIPIGDEQMQIIRSETDRCARLIQKAARISKAEG